MKHLFIYFCIGFAILSCTHEIAQSTSISVLADKTHAVIPAPSIGDFHYVFDGKHNVNMAIEFSYQIIGNTDINKRRSLSLPAYSILGNTLLRKTEMDSFFATIDTLFHREQTKEFEYKQSHIFIPLVQRLKAMQQSQASEKVILLYSDLVEHSPLYNGYSTSHKRSMDKDYDTIVDLFQSHLTLDDYSGITLYIIYYPTSTLENQLFSDFCKIYKSVFKDTGLKIRIGMDNNITSSHE
ncbi:hypothetical protein IMCC3317_34330 [Kordia antarctica]|uniref:Uncharacterized protein n=1 Tax=Kordia antarctica TaxID=1218801 RepID=A0A7L4ZNN9_9FLAO|nr:hypothetical protein [Kordia antarctica]QHI38049.1 hypothetical protein IMCC3317_34330 [Kordia antarctica]